MEELVLRQEETIKVLLEQNEHLKEQNRLLNEKNNLEIENIKKKISEDSLNLETQKVEESKEKKEEKELLEKRHTESTELLKGVVASLDSNNQNTDQLEELKLLNKNLTVLVESQEVNEGYQSQQLNVGTITLSLLIIGVGAYASIKIGMWVVSKLNRLIFY